MTFYQGFTLDTLLGVVSCLLGIAALIIGGNAYHNSKIVQKAFNDHKEFKDNSEDHSQRAGGDIINNTCDTNALANLTAANFDISLKHAYETFDQQAKINLQNILEETSRIIKEQKPNLSSLSKVDWINIYFESAKNTSDVYMQNIWAKVLIKESETPGSFSFNTLDVLKNMSSDDFMLFEKMCSLEADGFISQKNHEKFELDYIELISLSEHGLINMGLSKKTYTIPAHGSNNLINKSFVFLLGNPTESEQTLSISVYLLSSAAKELQAVANYACNLDYAKEIAKALCEKNEQVEITLHRIISKNGNKINYQNEDLFSTRTLQDL